MKAKTDTRLFDAYYETRITEKWELSKRKKEPNFTSVLLKYLCVCLMKLITWSS